MSFGIAQNAGVARIFLTPLTKLLNLAEPCPRVLGPGLPSLLRARKLPSMAMRRTTSCTVGVFFGGSF